MLQCILHILVNFVDFSSNQKYPDTWIPMDKLSIIQVSMISNQESMVSNYPSIHGIQISGYQKKVVSTHPYLQPNFDLKQENWNSEGTWLLYIQKVCIIECFLKIDFFCVETTVYSVGNFAVFFFHSSG
jgi:hypothetical protein